MQLANPTLLSDLRLGLDIGGTKTQAVVVDPTGTVLATSQLRSGYGHDGVIESSVQAVRSLARQVDVGDSPLGIGIPGMVDSATGRVTNAVNLGLVDVNLGVELSRRLGRPVRVENDVNAAALGVHRLQESGGVRSLAFLNLGTGVASGIVINGELLRGQTGIAGEVGHIPITNQGARCACGQVGCIELYASGSGLARMWPTDAARPIAALFEAAAAGDEQATQVLSALTSAVASAVRILVLSVDVEKVVIGGGLASVGAPLLDHLRGLFAAWSAESPFLRSVDLESRTELLSRDSPAAAVGAALSAAPEATAKLSKSFYNTPQQEQEVAQ